MYPCYRDGVLEPVGPTSLAAVIGENLLYLAMWVLAGLLLWPVWMPGGVPVLAIGWWVLLAIVQVLLKKHNCSGCYYYGKTCHLGWGHLSAWWFPPDSGDPAVGMRLAMIYIVPPPVILLTALAWGFLTHVGAGYWGLLGGYMALNALSFPVRKYGCGRCAMRKVCAGSAAKGK